MDVFVCHTFYHILIAVVEKLSIYKDREIDLALAYSSTNLNGIETNATLNELFHSVYVITEKDKNDFIAEKGSSKKCIFRLTRIIRRAVDTRKFGRFVGENLENSFRDYENIRLFCDPDPIGYYFYTSGIKYYAIEDALNSYQNDLMAGWRTQLGLKMFLNRLGLQYIPHGYSWNCLGVEVNDASKICSNMKKTKVVNRDEMFAILNYQERQCIMSIFANDLSDVVFGGKKCLFLTQPLFPVYFKSLEDQISYYKIILDKNINGDQRLFIKPHPRDLTDYSVYFPDAVILHRDYPIEILNLIPDLTFDSAITVFSTSIDSLSAVESKFSVGYQPFLEYIRRFYENGEE